MGCSVTPRMCTRLVLSSRTKDAYSRRSVIVPTWKKSVAGILEARARRNIRQVGPPCRVGTRGMRRRRRILRIAAAANRLPKRRSSPLDPGVAPRRIIGESAVDELGPLLDLFECEADGVGQFVQADRDPRTGPPWSLSTASLLKPRGEADLPRHGLVCGSAM